MSFSAKLRAGRFPVSLEITPPQRQRPAVLLRRAALLGVAADAVNIIQRSERQSSLDASLALRAVGLDPVWHLVNRGRSRFEIEADLGAAAAGGIRTVLCLRGDHAAEDRADTPLQREVVAMARAALPGALIGATLNQYAPDGRAALRNLLAKLREGAEYVQTQPVFDIGALRPAIEGLRERTPATRVVAMAMPLLSLDAAARIEGRLGISLLPKLVERIATSEVEAWNAFDETVAALAAARWVDGLAVMTYEVDPPATVGERIIAALAAAGVVPAG